jgi:hypothetical protein
LYQLFVYILKELLLNKCKNKEKRKLDRYNDLLSFLTIFQVILYYKFHPKLTNEWSPFFSSFAYFLIDKWINKMTDNWDQIFQNQWGCRPHLSIVLLLMKIKIIDSIHWLQTELITKNSCKNRFRNKEVYESNDFYTHLRVLDILSKYKTQISHVSCDNSKQDSLFHLYIFYKFLSV